MSATGQNFIVIGENMHATRVLLKKSERIALNAAGEEGIVFTNEDGEPFHLRISEEEKTSEAYSEGRIKHVRLAVQSAMTGDEPDRSVALLYLRALANDQVQAGAHYLDINVDEFSNEPNEQIEAMEWLVTTLAPLIDIPLAIDSSNLETLRAGVSVAVKVADSHVGGPMVNSASLERIEALELAAELHTPLVVTAAGESGMPTDAEGRVRNAGRIIEESLAKGIPLAHIFVDPLVFPIAVNGEYGRHCLDAIAALRRRYGAEVHITGGMSNVSFGLPNRRLLNDVFLVLAIEAGADSGIIDPTAVNIERALSMNRTAGPFQLALDVLTGADSDCRKYMKAHRAGELLAPAS
jgi:5-methyltetrahydrofolate--homocysteine methyltransferase